MRLTRRSLAQALVMAAPACAVLRPSSLLAQPPTSPNTLIANVFISPCGQPFRAKPGAPYPVVDWFKQADKNADGKLDRDEFNADAEAFFKILDVNRDGFIGPYEVNNYETKIAPEVLGGRVEVSMDDTPRLWLAQFGGQGGMGGGGHMGGGSPTGQQPPSTSPPANVDESHQGAAPFSFFDEPEPVAAADVRFRGVISKADFLVLSNVHFDALDRKEEGYLTLDTLPMTPVQRRLMGKPRRRH